MKTLRQFFLFMGLILSSVTFAAVQTTDPGLAYFNQGQFDKAAEYWEGALSGLSENDSEKYIDISLRLSAAYQSLGHLKKALHVLESAKDKAEENTNRDPVRHAKVLLGLGDVYLAMRDFQDRDMDCKPVKKDIAWTPQGILDKSESYLDDAEEILTSIDPEQRRNLLVWASLFSKIGNVWMARSEIFKYQENKAKTQEALKKANKAYQDSTSLLDKIFYPMGQNESPISLNIQVNKLNVMKTLATDKRGTVHPGDEYKIENIQKMLEKVAALPNELHDKVFFLIEVANLAKLTPPLDLPSVSSSEQQPVCSLPLSLTQEEDRIRFLALKQALELAKQKQDKRAMADVTSNLALLYADKHCYSEAIQLTKTSLNYVQYPISYSPEDGISDGEDSFISGRFKERGNDFVSQRFKVYLSSVLDGWSYKKCRDTCQNDSPLSQEFFNKCKGTCQALPPLALQNYHPELLLRLERQLGILWEKQGQRQEAINAYKRAVEHLHVRHESRTISQSFRNMEENVYFELADLHLQQARKASNAQEQQEQQEQLKVAIDHIESFKAAELRNYFQDECVTKLKEEQDIIEVKEFLSSHPKTAVFYPIMLQNRVELLLVFHDGIRQFETSIMVEDLKEYAEELRQKLEAFYNYGPEAYRPYAKMLYEGLIEPVNEVLQKEGIDTLMIISHDVLLTIPFATLSYQDEEQNKKYLIEDYALVITPGWKLTVPKTNSRFSNNSQTLLTGLWKEVVDEEFPALLLTEQELEKISNIFIENKKLIDKDFTLSNLKEHLQNRHYSLIHMSTHGNFDADPNQTFLLSYDPIRLTMNDLESIVRLTEFRQQPIELLTLSACWTARGSKQAALGLSGTTVKAGVRNVLGTLWPIVEKQKRSSDIGKLEEKELLITLEIMEKFYNILAEEKDLSKAQVLQETQRWWLDEHKLKERTSNPFFWAPFVLIGNGL
jgi:CHAT domain-containing protein